jgi:hypothetical protein
VTIALVVVAGFESSAFVGGVAFAVAACIAGPVLIGEVHPQRRLGFVGGLAIAAVLVVCLIAPFVRDQLAAIVARGGARPIAISPYRVFGNQFPDWLRHLLDVPGYWLIILPVELPATFIAGVMAFAAARRSAMPGGERLVIKVFAGLAAAGLVVSWLFASTLGHQQRSRPAHHPSGRGRSHCHDCRRDSWPTR